MKGRRARFIALLGLAAVAFFAFAAAGCGGEGYTPPCECRSDEDCAGDRYCRGCRCLEHCESSQDCPDDTPNCDPLTHTCEDPCHDYACPEDMPNCGADGRCFGLCETGADCPPETPNCGADGLCFGPCSDSADCTLPGEPNCDPATGLCFGICSDHDDCLAEALPNCDPATGLCQGPCPDTACPEGMINCVAGGLCMGPCTAHAMCTDSSMPNCDLDPDSLTAGLCLEPCFSNEDCPSGLYPNCDPTPGVCLPPCSGDGDCPEELWKCDTAAGLCFQPACTGDSDCSPPDTVCEEWTCVPGCDEHADCAEEERCDLVSDDHRYHCEPRDCFVDADCTVEGERCDTDGLADPDGGGYCLPGCETHYDCPAEGYDCDPASGTCSAHDYGDIGDDCAGGCRSGLCLAEHGNVCSGFCCIQHDCPPDWACRPVPDGSGEEGRTVDACVPLGPADGARGFGEICVDGADCRSGVCSANHCTETCCTDRDCEDTGLVDHYCGVGPDPGETACFPLSATGNDPLGAPGCSTTGGPGDCRSNLCFTFYIPDTGCTVDSECPERRPTCWDLYSDGTTDCLRDFCVEHCCRASDCPDYGSELFACSKWAFGSGDYDVCMLFEGTDARAEGEACSSNGQCRSMVCSGDAGICRARCCTDEDCQNPLYPRCGLEQGSVYSQPRLLNVCLP
jgi:hypothetical protein